MDEYNELKKFLLNKFRENDFKETWLKGEKQNDLTKHKNPCINTKSINLSKFNIKINFPGYKTMLKNNNNLIYDYRVDLNGVPISHINVVLDLYNKTKQYPSLVSNYYELLKDIAIHAYNIDYSKYTKLDSFLYQDLAPEVLQQVDEYHISLGKKYNSNGNVNWSYNTKELASALSFIVLQEDINYPMPRFEGRRMPFYRYFEAIALNDPSVKTNYELKDVVSRTLAHNRPHLYDTLEKNNLYLKQLPY